MNTEPQTAPLTSPDWRAERIATIKKLYPDLFTDEGRLNPVELAALVTDGEVSLEPRYEFHWPGKAQAKRSAYTPSKARLAPDVTRSVDFDTTKNVIIEGENLEVLKLLSTAYYNKVKCIYIDPPYNTGHDFVYSDDYSEGKQAYWEKNGVFRDGVKVDTNSESAGRYHSNWLNMMLPRLQLAQMMLKDDGVIFVSIDDNEVHNLRKVMDEVFGEENFVTSIVWKKKRGKDNSAKYFSRTHEYLIVYAKAIENLKISLLPLSEETQAAYKNQLNDERGKYRLLGVWARGTQGGSKFEYTAKDGTHFSERLWLVNQESMRRMDDENRLVFVGDKVYRKLFLTENDGAVPETIWDDASNAANAAEEIKSLFDGQLFDTPKPIPYLKRIFTLVTGPTDLVVDFFAGSGTAGHAVMELNQQDGGSRNYLMVQIPEATDEESEAYKAGYKKISDITIERIKRAGAKIHSEKKELDVGFKVFKLTTSIFPENTYQSDPEKTEEENVTEFRNHLARAKSHLLFDPAGQETDLMFETLLKQGFALTMSKEKLGEFKENVVWKVTDGENTAIVCLDARLEDGTIQELKKYKEVRFVGLHRAVDTTKKWEMTRAFGGLMVLI